MVLNLAFGFQVFIDDRSQRIKYITKSITAAPAENAEKLN